MTDVTRILTAIERGDPKAADKLLPLVYEELRRLAARKMSQESPGQYADRVRVPTLLIDAEKEHYFKIKDNSGRVHEILKKNGVLTEYHVLKAKKHYDVYSGQCLDDVMKIEIAWFDKYLKGGK